MTLQFFLVWQHDETWTNKSILPSLEPMLGDDQIKVVHGVGYPVQNLSHFHSLANWTSKDEASTKSKGCWERYFENLYPDYVSNIPQE